MRKTKLALAIATSAMISTPVLATNGDALIGLGAQARAMGGTGTAAFFGSENALTNPALLGKTQGSEFAIGGTIFKPNVKATTTVAGAASQTSDNDMNIIPEVSMSTRLNDNWTFGLGIFGSAGMGVDYRDTDKLFAGYSNLQIMKFAPSFAYNNGNMGFGFAPVIQYGALDLNFKQDKDANGSFETTVGNGMSSDIGYGYNLGAYFDMSEDTTVALAYQSAISMKYKDQMTTAANAFGLSGVSDKLEQPAEIKIGIAHDMGNWTLTADAKQIKWGDAEGYKDFQWKDQNVFGLGAKYSGNGYWLGAGYNFGSDPIDTIGKNAPNNLQGYSAQAVDMFNNHFFPGIVERHFTFGGGYKISKNMAIDAAVAVATDVEKTVNTGHVSDYAQNGAFDGFTADATQHTVKHSQIGYTVSLRMNF